MSELFEVKPPRFLANFSFIWRWPLETICFITEETPEFPPIQEGRIRVRQRRFASDSLFAPVIHLLAQEFDPPTFMGLIPAGYASRWRSR